MIDTKKIQQNILAWYATNGRKLPRRQTTDPYAIHISEVMLQQTQVDRVIPYFYQRMKDFPDYQSLAQASKIDLLKHRSGLGFNARVLRLQQCAQEIVKNYNAKVPKNREKLMKLPGIGPYTSAAIMAFAWNLPIPVIDTNIRRVLIFIFQLPETITFKELEKFAEKVIPKGKSRDRHNALMDQGALLLTTRKTKIKPISKQSKFEGSDRQVRGRIVKQLTRTNNQLSIKNIEEEFPHKNIKKIVDELQKEGIVQLKGGILCIE